jgi:hypothetical protein
MKIKARGWPWQTVDGHWASNVDKTTGQKYGWNPFSVKGMGRFGGGWAFKFGITGSSSLRDWVIDLGFGSIRITFEKKGGAA